jgi:sarcosine oxidase subunit alpha
MMKPLPPGRWTDTSRPVSFTFDGRRVSAYAGQSIAAALYASGVRVFTRSFKYHRPRGLFCMTGDCPNCLMQVDGRPNVRTCIEPVRDNQEVRHQNAWPSLNFDLLRIIDWLYPLFPVGFYYKRFHKPHWLWPAFEHIVRHIAGLGRIDVKHVPAIESTIEHLHPDVCVIGAGPAGLAAALTAAEAGASVLLLDRQPECGGHLLHPAPEGLAVLESLTAPLRGQPRLQIQLQTSVFGIYQDHLIGAVAEDRLLKIRARQTIVCTGARPQPILFAHNDRPGILPIQGVQRLARLYGVRAGQRAVVLAADESGYQVAEDLADLGIEVVGLAGSSSSRPAEQHAWPAWENSHILNVRGHGGLSGVQIGPVGGREPSKSNFRPIEVTCDLLCLSSKPVPANELLLQSGMRFRLTAGGWQPEGGVAGLSAAGAVAGTWDPSRQILEGRLRGAEAAAALGYPAPALDEYRRQWSADGRPAAPDDLEERSHPAATAAKEFVCFCEDVSTKDLTQAVAEGFDNLETLKRYSTAGMGPCQGKMCSMALRRFCAQATGRTLAETGITISRPPAIPVDLAILAAGRFHPIRRTPLHHWHQAQGAKWMDAGQWKRPESYGDPEAEVRAVRNGVGIIDVSTLGKIEVIGPDAAELLERIYLNKWADLKPARVRYGVMCNEDGILFDDGVGVRLDNERFYLTATTGNAEAVFQWLELWRVTWKLNATILNQTSAMAAVNLAGPQAREVLTPLTKLDISSSGFPYMAFRQGEVAGVPSRLMRIGFVGELGYEIHCASGHAWHLWQALWEAGVEFGLKPFGVEAQRILRLEKGHLILGQDSDALSNPLEAGLEGLVRFDKPTFHGREPLQRLRTRGLRSRLVGFMMAEPMLVPFEGCQVVENGRPVGRVTSARLSPTLGRSLGLAWVPARLTTGDEFLIRWNGRDVSAQVTALPFYDPEGKRLKS